VYRIQFCIVTVLESDTRPRRRRAETVERLLDAALETFAEIGFAAASVEDICRRGGFTRGAFYSSFRTKDELFGALFVRETARNFSRAEEQLAGIEDEPDPVAAAVERCLGTFRADRTWVLVHTEYALHATRHPEAAAALRRHAEQAQHQLTDLIQGVSARLGIRLTLPANRLARIVLAVHDGVVIREVLGGPGRTGAAQDRAASDLERTALLLLLRSAIAAQPPTDRSGVAAP
jgi:AcrR family transcriptional regulator